jgi:L-iditol 2-dehydrogenase
MTEGLLNVELPMAHSPLVAQMRAAVYRGKGKVVVEDVPVPDIGPGEVLLRVSACGICGTDIKKIEYGFVKPPQILGHEIAGTVMKVGAGVSKWKPGDRAITFHHVPCGACFYCERKLYSQCATYKKTGVTAGFDPNGGGFAQFIRIMPWVVERGMEPIPPDVSFEEATFVEPVNTCLKAVEKARVAAGETAFVIGQGPIGLLLLMLARYRGASAYASDPMPERRERSRRCGATECFDPRSSDIVAQMKARTSGRGADVVLLAVPNPELVAASLEIARPGGRVLLFAQNDPQMRIEFPAATVGVEEKEILGSYSADVDLQAESAQIVFGRKLPLKEMITHVFPLDSFNDALAVAAHPAGNSCKVVVRP